MRARVWPGKVWLEMSTTDQAEVIRLGARVEAPGAADGELVTQPIFSRGIAGLHNEVKPRRLRSTTEKQVAELINTGLQKRPAAKAH